MADAVDIVNQALQSFGSRTTVTSAELLNGDTNEAIQANLAYENTRRELLRMAPWDCGLKFQNLVYITSSPGTPENPQTQPPLWQPGLPPPPWAYEYQYPVDCLLACYLIAQTVTGFANAVPIYGNVTTGFWPTTWAQPGIRFKTATDTFRPVTAAAVQSGGSGYAVGDLITLEGTPEGEQPIGAPAVLEVLTAPAGVVGTVAVRSQVLDAVPVQGGSYFNPQDNPVAQGSTTGSGSGATFNLTFGAAAAQRVILTNLEFATLAHVRDLTDINVMDPLFKQAWINLLGANIVMGLTGDKTLANMCIDRTNKMIAEARRQDGNEGLTVNDRIPDWLTIRGGQPANGDAQVGLGFDWGGMWPNF